MRFIFFAVTCCLCFSLHAQDELKGVWSGTITQGERSYYWEMRLDAIRKDGTVRGTTLIRNVGDGMYSDQGDYAMMNWEGRFKGSTLTFRETAIQKEVKSQSSYEWCLKFGDLILERDDERLYLKGPWKSDRCWVLGVVKLSKQVVPELPTTYELNKKMVFQHVLFVRTKTQLLPESEPELNSVCSYLKAHPSYRIRVAGHTDRVGDDDANRKLSIKRAETIKEYFVKKGVAAKRIATHGYGSDSLVCKAPCDMNMRVEFMLFE